MKQPAMIGATVIALSACASQQLTQDKCVIQHTSGFVGTTGNQQRITVAQNGNACVIGITIGRGQMGVGGALTTPPAHGTASVQPTSSVTLISYTPAPDYVGDDRFEVTFSPQTNLTVLAEVVPLPAK